MKRVLFICTAALLAVPLLAFGVGDKMWVTSQGSRLQSHRNMSSPTVEVLSVGSSVQILDKQGRWYKIRAPSGNRGWIYQGRLSNNKPVSESQSESGDLFGELTGSKIQARKADTSRSIRGLSSETRAYAENQHTPKKYRHALDKVLKRKVSSKQLSRFLRQGQLGVYAK